MRNAKHHLHTMLDDKTLKILEKNVAKSGLSKSAYIKKLILGTPIKARPSKEIGQLYTEINRIGTNINQIAKAVNSGYATGHDIHNSEFLLQKVHDLMFKVANP